MINYETKGCAEFLYLNKTCRKCGEIFEPKSGHTFYCDKCRPSSYKGRIETWVAHHKDWCRNYDLAHRDRRNYSRKNRRQEVVRYWNPTNIDWKTNWKITEIASVEVLKAEGWINIELLTLYYPRFAFDIVATLPNGKRALIQVTSRTHTHPNRHMKLASALHLGFYVLYINPSLTRYVLKNAFEDKNVGELLRADVYGSKLATIELTETLRVKKMTEVGGEILICKNL